METAETDPGATLHTGEIVDCVSPGEARLTALTPTGDWVEPESSSMISTGTWGLAVFDANLDGRLDLYLPRLGKDVLLLAEGEGRFSAGTLPASVDAPAFGAVPVDFDGDGDLDITVARMGPDLLLRSDGMGGLEDVTEALGFSTGDGLSFAATWADYDGDGDLDAAVPIFGITPFPPDEYGPGEGPPGPPSVLLENRGSAGFVDISALLPETNDGYPMLMGWHDLDGDRTPELVVVNDHGIQVRSNRVWAFNGTDFEDIGAELGLEAAIDGMGLGVGDLDGDLQPDLLITDWGSVSLFESEGGIYADTALARGLTPPQGAQVAWGAELADLDNDADLDVVVNFGFWELYGVVDASNPESQPDAVWLQDADGRFSEVASEWGVDHAGASRGLVVTDLDGDGSLDVLKQEIFGETRLLMGQCDGSAWIEIRLWDDTTNNRLGIGARIVVEADDQEQVRWLTAGGTGLAGGGPPIAHFGLGEATQIDRLEITWPDGMQSTFFEVDVRQQAQIKRP